MVDPVKRVLIVEDDPDIQVILKMVLSRLGKCELSATDQGDRVQPLAQEKQPHLILLDVMLPEMSGIEIIKALKADPVCKEIPVIFLTARSMPSEIDEMKRLGAIGTLAKPFDPMHLIPQINELLAPLGKAIGT